VVNISIGVHEMVLAVRLIVKGFNLPAVTSSSAVTSSLALTSEQAVQVEGSMA
jgi:hypothetical protein